MSSRAFPIVVLAGVLLIVTLTSLFTVTETQHAIRTQFGAIVGTNYVPGLHAKWPWDEIHMFEKRILTQGYQGETFLTNDNRGLIVDFYVKWKVNDAARYYQATGGREQIAGERLADIVKNGIKSVIAQRTLEQIVAAERTEVTGKMFERASRDVGELGVQLVDVRVQRIDLPEDVSSRVYESMKQNFAKIASGLRAEGSSAAVLIRAQAERKRTEILADAERKALQVRGSADAQAAEIYSEAYSQAPEFYAFYRSLQAYERSLGKDGDLLVLSPDSEFFKYLKNPGPPRR
jgi:modulator of FtsH protease HflC